MKKIFLIFLLFTLCFLLPLSVAKAICPVCTVAAGTGIVVMRNLGVDDTITGVWLGGFLISLTLWTVNWLRSKNIQFFGMNFLVGVFYYASVSIPFYKKNIISNQIFGSHYQTLWNIDKLVIGIATGSVLFLIGAIVYGILKKNNNGRAHFPFEKIVLPIAPLVIMSVIFYFITK